jgi:hypothetical protein
MATELTPIVISPRVSPTLVLTTNTGTTTTPSITVDASKGGARGPAGESLIVYSRDGDLSAGDGGVKRYRFPFPATILGVSAAIATAPTGADVVIDVLKNGVSVLTASKLHILDGFHEAAEVSSFVTQTVVTGEYLTVNIVSVGSIVRGADLTVFIRYQRV